MAQAADSVVFSYAPSFGVLPTHYLPDRDDVWASLLGAPQPGPKAAWCVRGAVFGAGAMSPTQGNVERVHGALFDLDREGGVPSFAAISQALEGRRFISWTTWSSFATRLDAGVKAACEAHQASLCGVCRVGLRLRLYVPYARPVTPAEHAYVWHSIHAMLDNVGDASQSNIDRLGYGPQLRPHEVEFARAHYAWCIGPGPRLDPYTRFGDGNSFPAEVLATFRVAEYRHVEAVPEPDRTDWYTDEEALERARVYFRTVGPGITPGGRHAELFKIGCKLWWDFWLPAQSVSAVLHEINQRFPQPKTSDEVEREVQAAFERTRGRAAVKQLDGQGNEVTPGALRRRPGMLTQEDILREVSTEKRSHDVLRRETGAALSTLIAGAHGFRPIGGVETRDRNLRLCARHLGTAFPEHDPDSILSYFAGPVNAAHAQEPWQVTPAQIRATIVAAQEEVRKVRERRRNEERTQLTLRIQQATNGKRSTPYTMEDIYRFMDEQGIDSLEVFYRRLIIYGAGANYILVDGKYKAPVKDADLPTAVEVDLSPYVDVSVHKADKDGTTLLDRQEILSKYGTLARNVVVDMAAQRSYYDLETDTFVEAPCPVRDLSPQYSPEVAGWLDAIGDPALLDWLACAPDLNQPLPALYLHGAPGSGKNLMASALARLFGDAVTPMTEAFSDFNAQMAKNPVLFADETLPRALRGPSGADEFKAFTTERSRPLRRKFLGNVTLRGCPRLILAANNRDMLPRSTGYSNDDDIDALAQRVLYVHMPLTARVYIEQLPDDVRASLVEKDVFARHVLWLRGYHTVHRTSSRFGVVRPDVASVRAESFQGPRGEVLNWVCATLVKKPQGVSVPLVRHGSATYVALNATYIVDTWKNTFGFDARVPERVDLLRAIRTLQNGVKESIRMRSTTSDTESVRYRWRLVPLSAVAQYAHESEYDEHVLEAALQQGLASATTTTEEDFQ
jgi:hypothetical protein